MSTYYPPGAFYFGVTVIGVEAALRAVDIDGSFQEVTGIQSELETESVNEGGENRFTYRLPRQVRYPNLVLKRGIVTFGSAFVLWITTTLSSGLAAPVTTKDLMVSLFNTSGIPLLSWVFVAAYPLRWELAPLDSTKNQVLVETLEFSYNYFNRIPGYPL